MSDFSVEKKYIGPNLTTGEKEYYANAWREAAELTRLTDESPTVDKIIATYRLIARPLNYLRDSGEAE